MDLKHGEPDHCSLQEKNKAKKIVYPKPDGKISFDRLTNVSFLHLSRRKPTSSLKISDEKIPIDKNLALYDSPEQRYCPAGVYEIVNEEGLNRLK